jgi:23S rRNA (guanosine2251-2'-O)-methyltransferase
VTSSALSSDQIKKLRSLLELSLQIETQNETGAFDSAQLEKLSHLLLELNNENLCELKRLAEIPKHFSSGMTLRHFTNLMIPLERLLDRALRDDDFLTQTTDHPEKVPARRPIYFVLDNIRSAFNVGSIFRLADCVGACEIFLCGYTPGPEQEAVVKTALSANKYVSSRHCENVEEALIYLKSKSIRIVALETVEKSTSLFSTRIQGPTAFLVGNERFGLNYSLLKEVDEVRHIPLHGVKNSLNVAQALSVAAFEWSKQNP